MATKKSTPAPKTPAFFTATPIRSKLPASKENETYVAVTFNIPVGSGKERPALDIAIALDVSGSMADPTGVRLPSSYGAVSRLRVAQHAINTLLDQLTERDRLAIATFDSFSQLAYSSSPMNETNRAQAKKVVDQQTPGSATALCAGLQMAMRQLGKDPSHVRRALLFTDGEANQGPRDLHSIRQALASEGQGELSCSTFGFGRTYSAELLAGLANNGGGAYHIDDAAKISTAFGTEFGALASTYATDVEVRLVPTTFASIVEVINPLETRLEGGTHYVKVPALLEGQTFSIVVKMKTNKRSRSASNVPLLTTSATMMLTSAGARFAIEGIDATVDLTTAKAADKVTDNPEVASALAIQLAARAQKQADEQARRGDYAAAAVTLSASSDMSFSLGRADLGNIQKGLVGDYSNRNAFMSRGQRIGASIRSAYATQRATTGGQSSGGVAIDDVFGTQKQKQAAGLFSINKASSSGADDMPNVDDMVTD